jgi:hypothetical protein
MTDLMERVVREEREWAEARLHERLHGNWLGKDECPVCLSVYPESPYLRLTPMARARLGRDDFQTIAARAESMGTVVGAIWSSRHGWVCTAETAGKRVQLRGHGPLAAVLAGILDDVEAL